MAKYDKLKIAKSMVRGTVNFWGGKNIPALQTLMTFALDPDSILKKYQIPQKDVSETGRALKDIERLHADAIKEEEKLDHLRRGYIKLVLNMVGIELIITTIDPNSFLPRNVYNVTSTIINTNKLDKKLVPHVFYAIDVNSKVDQSILKKYAEGIVQLRKLEQDMRTQDSKVRQKYNLVLQKMQSATNNIKNKKMNGKKNKK